MRRTLLAALLLAVGVQACAAGIDYPYTVTTQDNLYAISTRLLDRPSRWKALQKLNRIADPYHLKPGSVINIPLVWLRPTSMPAYAGQVRGATVNGKPAANGQALTEGDILEVSPGGAFILKFPDGSTVMLSGGTVAELTKSRQAPDGRGDNVLKLKSGRAESHANPDKVKGSGFVVSSPLANAGVRGTRFRVSYAPESAQGHSEVLEGLVEFSNAHDRQLLPAGTGTAVHEQGRIDAPQLLLAPPDLSRIPTRFERIVTPIGWQPLTDASGYLVRVTRPENPDFVIQEARTDGADWTLADLPDGHYLLSVRGIRSNGVEGLDATQTFDMDARPESPLPIAPAPGSNVIGPSVQLAWAAPSGDLHYHLQISLSEDFSAPLKDLPALASTNQALPLPPGDYVWRIASVSDQKHGPFSDPVRFRLYASPPEAALSVNALGEVSLNWPHQEGIRYRVQVSGSPTFSTLTESRMQDGAATTISGLSSGEWYVRIGYVAPDGKLLAYSTPQKFVIHGRLVDSQGRPVYSGFGQPIGLQ